MATRYAFRYSIVVNVIVVVTYLLPLATNKARHLSAPAQQQLLPFY